MTDEQTTRQVPGAVATSIQPKVYHSTDVQAAGGTDAFMKSIGADKEKQLPAIEFTEDEWTQMLNEENR